MWDKKRPPKEKFEMNSLIDIQKRLLPDLLAVLQKRYQILKFIGLMEPVGRRSLAASLNLTERVLRGEVEFLKNQSLVSISGLGMHLTANGNDILEQLNEMMRDITGIAALEEKLQSSLSIEKVIIVSGNNDESPLVKKELGRAAAMEMKASNDEENIIAVTGGSTMAAIAEMLTPEFVGTNCLFVPARGGIGENVKNQANTICSIMADHTHSKHRALYVPDHVRKEIYDSFIKEPEISEILTLIRSANIVLHGIGDALTMAERRKTNAADLQKLRSFGAVGEAFGYYFNEAGEVVHKVQTIGLQLEDLSTIPHVIAVAGGKSKAKAIAAYMKCAPKATVLITDEGAARQLLKK